MIGVTNRDWFLAVSLWALQLTTATEIRRLHLFDRKKTTFNHAQEMCESIGMNLVTVDRPEVITAMKILLDVDTWTGLEEFWTGLHIYDEAQPDEYVWVGSCRRLQPSSWNLWGSQTGDATERCVRNRKSLHYDNDWEPRPCQNNDGSALCEHYSSGVCDFQEIPEHTFDITMDAAVNTTNLDGLSLSECQTECRNHGGVPSCWAVLHVHQATPQTCTLYFSESIKTLHEILKGRSGASVHFRFCFEGTINTTDFTVQYREPRDAEPWNGCSEAVNETSATEAVETFSTEIALTTKTTTTTETLTASPPPTTKTASQTTGSTMETPTSAGRPTTTTTELLTTRITMEPPRTTTTEPQKPTTTGAPTSITTEELRTGSAEIDTTVEHDMSTSSTRRSTMRGNQTKITTKESKTNTFPETTRTDVMEITTAVSISPTSDSQEEICVCPCRTYPNLTTAEKEEFIQDIITNLTIDTRKVSKTRRKYESAYDPRPSARTVGGVGVAMLSLTVGGLFLLDVGALSRDLTSLWHTLCGKP